LVDPVVQRRDQVTVHLEQVAWLAGVAVITVSRPRPRAPDTLQTMAS